MTEAAPATPQPKGQGPQPTSLSPRALEVVALIADDLSDKEIAHKLEIKVGTVRCITYIARLKLNVRGRVGLALWYIQDYKPKAA